MSQIAHELAGAHAHRRLYDRFRAAIEESLAARPRIIGAATEVLLLAPDLLVLLLRLTFDRRVAARDKLLFGSVLVYFAIPFDFLPEARLGSIGYVDDAILGIYVLNQVLMNVDPEVLREQWSGRPETLERMQRTLVALDSAGDRRLGALVRQSTAKDAD